MMDMWLFSESKLRTKFDTIKEKPQPLIYTKTAVLEEGLNYSYNLLYE